MRAFDALVYIESCLVRRANRRDRFDLGRLDDYEVDWAATIKRCNDEFVAPALWSSLDDAGALPNLPNDVRDYLELVHTENARCNRQIRAQCEYLGDILAGIGAEAVLLKGATCLFENGPGAADRMMRDVDLLVDPVSFRAVNAALEAGGYRELPMAIVEEGHIHGPPLVHPSGLVSVEVHVELTTRPTLLPGREVLAQSRAVASGLRLPAPAHRLIHGVLHSQIVNGDFTGGIAGLRDCLDLARLIGDDLGSIDWPHVAAEAKARGYFRQLSGALHNAARFAGSPLPQPFAADRGGARHAWRCAAQREWPLADRLLRAMGVINRAMAWERDSYALGLGTNRGLAAHLKVNRRRAGRISRALRRAIRG